MIPLFDSCGFTSRDCLTVKQLPAHFGLLPLIHGEKNSQVTKRTALLTVQPQKCCIALQSPLVDNCMWACIYGLTDAFTLQVTWVEHTEYDEASVHQLYRPLLRSGLAFGARRWLAMLQRQCECLAILMSPDTVSANDSSGTEKTEPLLAIFHVHPVKNCVHIWSCASSGLVQITLHFGFLQFWNGIFNI